MNATIDWLARGENQLEVEGVVESFVYMAVIKREPVAGPFSHGAAGPEKLLIVDFR
jgi:hypothetical protein